MKIHNIKYYPVLLFIISLKTGLLTAQDSLQLNGQTESVAIISDRNLYCINENINFCAFNTSSDQLKKMEWSKVIYVELINSIGESVAKGKFYFDSIGSTGQIEIPENCLTGIYFLKAYTKWMRNYPTSCYGYSMLKIINPFNKNILQSFHTEDSIDIKPTYNHRNNKLIISSNKKTYQCQEKGFIEVESQQENLNTTINVSIIRKGLFDSLVYSSQKLLTNSILAEYIPETRGISISGTVLSQSDSLPIAYSMVNATVFSDRNTIYNNICNKNGRFNLSLNDLKDFQELYITTKKNSGKIPIIQIDNDFCTKQVTLPDIPLKLTKEENILAEEICKNAQINKAYKADDVTKLSITNNPVFYGKPDNIILFNKFIDLPTMHDYIHEVMPNVSIKTTKGKEHIDLYGIYSEMHLFKPLILLDLVPVFDDELILKVSPKDINRAEIINEPYIIGKQTFGGIISFFSNDSTMAGIELPSWSTFLKFQGYQTKYYYLEQDKKKNISSIPDLRNCLLFDNYTIHKKEVLSVNFSTGLTKGEYLIVVRGIDKNNNNFYNYKSIFVE